MKSIVRTLLREATRSEALRGIIRQATQHHQIPAVIWKRLPVEAVFPLTLPDASTVSYRSVAQDTIGRALYWGGLQYWEPETVVPFYRLAQQSRCTLDVGANTGLFTLLAGAANPHARVISFEPLPISFDSLQANVRENHWEGRCEARCEAVSDVMGTTQFHVPTHAAAIPKSGSLHREGHRGIQGVLIDVPVVTLDEVCKDIPDIDLVKIDVEGFEHKVLEGMRTILARSAPTLIVECNEDGPYRTVEQILRAFGYRFYHLHTGQIAQVDHIVPDKRGLYRNYLCVARDGLELIRPAEGGCA